MNCHLEEFIHCQSCIRKPNHSKFISKRPHYVCIWAHASMYKVHNIICMKLANENFRKIFYA